MHMHMHMHMHAGALPLEEGERLVDDEKLRLGVFAQVPAQKLKP